LGYEKGGERSQEGSVAENHAETYRKRKRAQVITRPGLKKKNWEKKWAVRGKGTGAGDGSFCFLFADQKRGMSLGSHPNHAC